MTDHSYELKYLYGSMESTVRFSADINIEQLQEYLESFLLSSGWGTTNIDILFGRNDY